MGNPLIGFKDWSFGRLAALASKIGDPETCEAVLRGERLVTVSPAVILAQATDIIPANGSWVAEWRKFYREVFRLQTAYFKDFNKEFISPPKHTEFRWVLMVAKGLTLNEIREKCESRFEITTKESYFQSTQNCYVAQPYFQRLRSCLEADEIMKDVSAEEICKRGLKSITLLERLLLELWYFWKTGKHLDNKSYTLCAGSQTKDGCVPMVRWDSFDKCLFVEYCKPDYHSESVRIREVI